MRVPKLLSLAVFCVATSPAFADDDLLSLYREARVSDPVFQQAIAERNALEEQLPQARANLRPSVAASAGADRTWESGESTVTGESEDEAYNTYSYGIELRQPLYDFTAVQQLARADALVAQAQAEFASAEQELMIRVSERYFAVLDARVAVEAAEAQVAAIERQLQQALQRFEVGVIARTDVEEARAAFDLAQADLLLARSNLESAREQLRVVTGQLPEELAQVRPEIELSPPTPAEEEAWRERAEEQNWSLLAARLAAEAAMESVDVARGGRYPTVDGFASYGYEDSGGGTRGAFEGDSATIGIQIELPLYTGGATSSRIREAQFRYTEARQVLEEVRRSVTRSAADAFRGVVTALRRVDALDQARESTRAALEATQAGFEVGTRTIVDVLDAQREVIRAERDYQQARHDYLLNTLRLQQAAGILSEDDIAAVNSLLTYDEP
jgi:outer membrane protein